MHVHILRLNRLVTLDTVAHKYSYNHGSYSHTFATSVTTFIEQFTNKFDPDITISKYYNKWQQQPSSKYYGLTKEQIKQMWKDNGHEAATHGTHIHDMIEQYYIEGAPIDTSIPEMVQFNAYLNDVPRNWIPIVPECKVFDERIDIAGSVDMIYRNAHTGGIILVDWKTSKDINKPAFRGGKLKAPFNMLPDNKVGKYTMQLSMYANMIRHLTGETIEGLYIVCFNPENTNYVMIKVQDVSLIFEDIVTTLHMVNKTILVTIKHNRDILDDDAIRCCIKSYDGYDYNVANNIVVQYRSICAK